MKSSLFLQRLKFLDLYEWDEYSVDSFISYYINTMTTLTLTKKNFITMIPNIYDMINNFDTVQIIAKDTIKNRSWYDYVISGDAFLDSENDTIITNKKELQSYLHTLKSA